jgi:hypothetical protein
MIFGHLHGLTEVCLLLVVLFRLLTCLLHSPSSLYLYSTQIGVKYKKNCLFVRKDIVLTDG